MSNFEPQKEHMRKANPSAVLRARDPSMKTDDNRKGPGLVNKRDEVAFPFPPTPS